MSHLKNFHRPTQTYHLSRLNRHSALKVVKSATRYAETALDEINLLSQISRTSPSHPGLNHIVTFLDSFSHYPSIPPQSPTLPLSPHPQAGHLCIVFEPLGENLLSLLMRHKKKGVPRALAKYIARQVLQGLEYLHDECDLVHTDIKPENIRASFSLLPHLPPYPQYSHTNSRH